ncbi:MAG: PAS domain S-box protein [Myxococcales bacterium]|nr:PAS domain S-box protein [Myxococcales bacterium]
MPSAPDDVEPQLDELLRESAEDLYENAPCGYFSARTDGVVVRVNETLLRWLGFRRAEVIGRRFVDLVTVGGRILYETHYAPLLDMQGFVNEVAFELVRADARRLPVLVSAVYRNDAAGRVKLLRATVFNITERKQYERELLLARKRAELERSAAEEERERFRVAFAEAAVGMAVVDLAGHFLRTNPTYSRITGYSEAELLERDIRSLTHPDDWAENHKLLARLIGGEFPGFVIEKRYVRKDDTSVWVKNSVSLARDAGGAPLNIIAISEDITAQRTMEIERTALFADMQRARAEAEEANRAKDEFVAMLGHELRNPLAPIQTALQLMRMRGDGEASHERSVIERQVGHMIRLVDDLLDISRITRGEIQLRRERVSMAEVVAKGVEMASPLVEGRQHQLSVSSDGALFVDGDAMRLAQVVSNLINNAAKYTPVGGDIQIKVARVADSVECRVRDNGVGLTEEMMPRVFELFVQAKQALDRSQGGLGLGLPIARRIAEAHKGTLRGNSEGRGRGSEFILRLPLATAADVAQLHPIAVATRTAASRAEPLRVLIVDDNQDAADLLGESLRLMGCVAGVAYTVTDALALAPDLEPDVALLDIGLPVMDGYELLRELRALLNKPLRFTAALTGYGQAADRTRSREAGFDEHLVKPIDLDRISEVLDEIRASR